MTAQLYRPRDRSRELRWSRLSNLLLSLERVTESAKRLDAYNRHSQNSLLEWRLFEHRMEMLSQRIDLEINRTHVLVLKAAIREACKVRAKA